VAVRYEHYLYTATAVDVLCHVSQDARLAKNNEVIKASLKEYDEELERYIPVLMAQVTEHNDGYTTAVCPPVTVT